MERNDFKVGQKVYNVRPLNKGGMSILELIVVTVGREYVHAIESHDRPFVRYKFSISNGYEIGDVGLCGQLYLSKDKLHADIKRKVMGMDIRKNIYNVLHKMTNAEIESIHNLVTRYMVILMLALFAFASCKPSQNAIKGTNNWKPGLASKGHPYSKHQAHYKFSGSLSN